MEILPCLSNNIKDTLMLKSTFCQFLHYLDTATSRYDHILLHVNIVKKLKYVHVI